MQSEQSGIRSDTSSQSSESFWCPSKMGLFIVMGCVNHNRVCSLLENEFDCCSCSWWTTA